MKTVVFRVQDSEGRGPWRPGFSHKWVQARDDHTNLMPWQMEFGLGIIKGIDGFLGCGCNDLESLRRWFTEREYAKLLTYGYHCVRMEIDRIIATSDIQVLFERAEPLHSNVNRVSLYVEATRYRESRS